MTTSVTMTQHPARVGRLTPVAISAGLLASSCAMAQTADVAPSALPTQASQAPALSTVDIVGRKTPYVLPSSRSATRTDTPVEHIPQSIVVLPRALLGDQGVHTLNEALRNASNVNEVDPRDANNVVFKIRGFTSSVVVDGVAMPGYFAGQESLANVERLDVIKGPAGDLFGSNQGVGSYGTLGGTVAITSAEPSQKPVRRLNVRLGSQQAVGLGFDVNQPLNDEWAVRLAGEFSREGSETDWVFFRRQALFPSVSWTPNGDTQVVLRARYQDNTTLDYSGLPLNGTLNTTTFTLPRSTMIAASDQPDTTQSGHGVNLQWHQRLNPDWTFDLTAAYQRAQVDQRGSWLVDATSAMGCFAFGSASASANLLCGARMWDRFTTTTLSPSVTGRIRYADVQHTVSLGLDLERTRDDAFMTYSNGFGTVSLTPVSLLNPVYPTWVEPAAPNPPDQQNRYNARVLYVQDQVDAGAWHLLGSLRHSQLDVTDVNPAWGVDNHSSQSKTTPRLGVVFDVNPQLSVFAGYSVGIKVPTVSIFSTPPKPEQAEQKEIGLRTKDFHGVTATVAWFELDRKNAAVGDPSAPGRSIQTGLQRSRGVDVDVRWKLSRRLTALAAATVQQARVVEDTNTALVDKWLFNVPQKAGRLALRYDIADGAWSGLGAGLGVTARGHLAGDSTNSFFTPAATVWDAQLSYRLQGVRYGMGVSNLFNKQYYQPSAYFAGGQVTPAQPRRVSVSAQMDF